MGPEILDRMERAVAKVRERLLRAADDAEYRRELLNDQRKRDGGTP